MVPQLGGRRRGRCRIRQLKERLAGDPDFLGSPAEFVQLLGQLRNLLPRLPRLRGDPLLGVLVSRRAITSLIAQYALDSELAGRCS
ncbi:hypothetical protein GCM10010353_08370 [Streptomyces chryseus]|nr:hypothetical protein GCM10010353_08370 [Streptomyces chryseus]